MSGSAAGAPSPREDASELQFSVLLPLRHHRGMVMESVDGWANRQDFERSRYEVIALADVDDPALSARVAPLLAPHDSLLDVPSRNMTELFDVGIRRARGTYLFLVEAHSVPEPDCLSEMAAFLEGGQFAGGICANEGISPSRMSRLEDEIYHDDPLEKEDHWKKITIRGSTLRRDIYLECGGFEYAFGHFAEVALGARVHDAGYRIGLAPKAVVHHYGASRAGAILGELRQYGRDEMAYRAAHSAAFCEHYFGRMPEWSARLSYARPAAAALAGALARSLAAKPLPTDARVRLALLLRYGTRALVGCKGLHLRGLVAVLTARMRLRLWRSNPRRLYRAFHDHWRASIRLGRTGFIREHVASLAPRPLPVGSTAADALGDDQQVGFFHLESDEGGPFRWTEAAAAVYLPAGPARARLVFVLAAARPEGRPPELGLYVAGRRFFPAADRPSDREVCFEVTLPTTGATALPAVLLARAYRPGAEGSDDPRALGVPVRAIRLDPVP